MRILIILAFASLLAGAAPAQSPVKSSDAPDVVVTRISWQKQIYNPALLEDPMLVGAQQSQMQREQRLARDVPLRETPAPKASPLFGIPSSKKQGGVRYVYRARIRNTGDKTIREIGWEYLLSDPTTELEVGRHLHSMKINLPAGKTKELIARSNRPPAGILLASNDSAEAHAKYSERVIINRIRYADGSVWQRPSK